MNFVGLDLETSGTSHEKSVPIQLGLATEDRMTFGRLIGGWDWDEHEWDEESALVHKIPRIDLAVNAKAVGAVDEDAADWLKGIYGPEAGKLYMVGWNVAGFDRPFVERWLPKTFSLFSYRTVDLNALCFALVEPGRLSYRRIKRLAKEAGESAISGAAQWHDARYDAQASLVAFDFLRDVIKGKVQI